MEALDKAYWIFVCCGLSIPFVFSMIGLFQ